MQHFLDRKPRADSLASFPDAAIAWMRGGWYMGIIGYGGIDGERMGREHSAGWFCGGERGVITPRVGCLIVFMLEIITSFLGRWDS